MDNIPKHLKHLEVSLDPFMVNGEWYRVVSTIIGKDIHRHRVVRHIPKESDVNDWIMEHARIKENQDRSLIENGPSPYEFNKNTQRWEIPKPNEKEKATNSRRVRP